MVAGTVTYVIVHRAFSKMLFAAVEGGDVHDVELALRWGGGLEGRDEQGDTPLHRAAKYGREDIVRLLISRGAEVDARNIEDYTPLHVARNCGTVDALLAAGAVVGGVGALGNTPLHMAVYDPVVTVYYSDPATEKLKSDALRADRARIVKALIAHGADVNARARGGLTPLHVAAMTGHAECARVLLDHGADRKSTEISGLTPAGVARAHGYVALATELSPSEEGN